MKQQWVAPLWDNGGVDGPAISNSTTATSIIGTTIPKLTLGANQFTRNGETLFIRGMFQLSNLVTTPGTLTIDVRFGSTVVFNGGAMQLSTTAHTTLPVQFEIELEARSMSTAAQFLGYGRAFGQPLSISGADPTTGDSMLIIPNVTPALGTAWDSSSAQQVDVFATFSIASASNVLTMKRLAIHSPN